MRLASRLASAAPSARTMFPLRWWLQVGCFLALVIAIVLWQPRAAMKAPVASSEEIVPGLTLRRFAVQTPAGATQIHAVTARGDFWAYEVKAARGTVFNRETATVLAKTFGARVAVNGGFFAYGGAPLGAVKIDKEWIRLPWKSRTALLLKNGDKARIANLSGQAQLILDGQTLDVVGLNGYPAKDAISLMTPRFGTVYQLRENESALEVTAGKVTKVLAKGGANIRPNGFLVVANGTAQKQIEGATTAQSAEWKVQTTPASLNDYPTILGAGPRLVQDGIARETSTEEEFRPDVLLRGSRTGVGVDKDGNLLLVVADGKDARSPGLTLPELADVMAKLGARDALHMDCGPSSVLIVNQKIANHPWDNQPAGGNEPTLPNVIMIGSAKTP